jgi:hypothetical protein
MSFAITHAMGDDTDVAAALFWDQDWLRSRGEAFISSNPRPQPALIQMHA